jgi:histidinol-phosphatase (PHP family)
MELNTSGLMKSLPEMNPGRSILELMHARGIPVVLGADAHRPERVGDRYAGAMRILQSVGYRDIHLFLERKRQAVSIADALVSLGESPGTA